jgi:hypothetical protein
MCEFSSELCDRTRIEKQTNAAGPPCCLVFTEASWTIFLCVPPVVINKEFANAEKLIYSSFI